MTTTPALLNATMTQLPEHVALPRKNGEPVFDAPWQSRAFGMVVTLHEQGTFPWSAFKDRLIEEIGATGQKHPDNTASYYEHWLAAFERLVADVGLLTPSEIDRRTGEFSNGDRREMQ